METRECDRCGNTFPASEFPPDGRRKDGISTRCATCKREHRREYRREYQREYQRQLRAKGWKRKEGQYRCFRCGETKDSSKFSTNPSRYNGLASQCKDCVAAQSRAYYRKYRERELALRPPRRKPRHSRTTEPTRCTRCGEVKPASEFHIDDRKYNGLRAHCKACKAKTAQRLKAQRAANPAPVRRRSFWESVGH